MIEIEGLIDGTHKEPFYALLRKYPFITSFSNVFFMLASDDDEYSIKEYRDYLILCNNNLNKIFHNHKLDDYIYDGNINLESLMQDISIYINSVEELFDYKQMKMNNKLSKFNTEIQNLIQSLLDKNIKNIKKQLIHLKCCLKAIKVFQAIISLAIKIKFILFLLMDK